MTDEIKAKVHAVLDNYLESNMHRKTPERYAILNAVYSLEGHFTLDDLSAELEKKHFRVSRATLYNTMHLFIKLRLVVKHGLAGGPKYEACYSNENHLHQVCTLCGKVTEIRAPQITAAILDTKLKRFRRDAFALYIYGLCSSCQAKMTRKRNNAGK